MVTATASFGKELLKNYVGSQGMDIFDEVLCTCQPTDAVVFVAPFLHGNAWKWLINLCDAGQRLHSWPCFKELPENGFSTRSTRNGVDSSVYKLDK